MKTLAVSGTVVPLVEGHADTRKRWTANLVTFSDKERIKQGPPYCEFVFKGGDKLQERLRKYLSDHGYGPWISVATTDSASYKTPDVIEFLKTHLPDDFSPQLRQWRIIIADCFSAHLSDQVFNLCWSRGYVLITLGGGITPVVQTCDTDLNQHVKRKYMELETAELLQQMRDGINVPHNSPERCIELMADVLSSTSLHMNAAEGYVKVGFTVPLDGSGDQFICREAGNFWRQRGMRNKVDEAIRQVNHDVRAERIQWSYHCVKQLLVECPAHDKYDRILKNIEADDEGIPEGELPYAETDEEGPSDAEDDGSGGDDEGQHAAGVDVADEANADDGSNDHDAVEQCHELVDIDSRPEGEGLAAHVAVSTNKIRAYTSAMETFEEAGAIKMAVQCKNAIDSERRRLRYFSKEDPAVALQLMSMQDAEAARQRKRRRELAEANDRASTLKRLKTQIKEETAMLAAQKRKLAEEANHAKIKSEVATFTPESLGYQAHNWRKVEFKKRRYDVLDRLSKLGKGLSPAQMRDFGWFKESWDEKMLDEEQELWGFNFLTLVQKILLDVAEGQTNAFSKFMHSETHRVLDHAIGVRL